MLYYIYRTIKKGNDMKNAKEIAERLAKHYGQVAYWKDKRKTRETKIRAIMKWICQEFNIKCAACPDLKHVYKVEAVSRFRNELKAHGYKFDDKE